MKFHFWGQVPWFAWSIVVNVNCPAPTVSLNGHQCLSSQENCTDLLSTWSEDVRPYCFLLITILPLLSVLLPFSPVSCFQMFPSYDETLTSLSWLLVFLGALRGRPSHDPSCGSLGGEQRKASCWVRMSQLERLSKGTNLPVPSRATGSRWKEPRAQSHSKWIILECNVRSCLPLYPHDLEQSRCGVNTRGMTILASSLYEPNHPQRGLPVPFSLAAAGLWPVVCSWGRSWD